MPEAKFQNFDEYLDYHSKKSPKPKNQYEKAFYYNEYIRLKLDVATLCLNKMKAGSKIIEIGGNRELEIKIGDEFFGRAEMYLVELRGSLDSLAQVIKYSLNLSGQRETNIQKIVGELGKFPLIKEKIEELFDDELYKRFDEYRNKVIHGNFNPGLRTIKDDSVKPPVMRKTLILFLSNPEKPPYSWEWKLPDKEDIEIVPFFEEMYKLISATIDDIKNKLFTELR